MSELVVGSIAGLAANSYEVSIASGSTLNLTSGAVLPFAGVILNASATATTGISATTATTVLTASGTIKPGKRYVVSGQVTAQSGSNMTSKFLWVEQASSGFKRGLWNSTQTQSANLPFTMNGVSSFTASDVGVTTGSGTSLEFTLRVYFAQVTGLNTNPDSIVGANSYPQVMTIVEVGDA